MLGVIQRVSEAEIRVGGERISRISGGVLLLVGIGTDDGQKDISFIADKTANLRIFPDDTKVYTGHGDPTTIDEEKKLNSYVRI
jgi:D-tyrosyl-tRNA(Tyr) deacylase